MLQLPRLSLWAEFLDQVITEHQSQPFAWGKYDCATLWLDAVHAMLGHNLRAELGKWKSEAGARKVVKAAGVASVREYVARHFREVPAAHAHRGDLAFPDVPSRGGALVSPAVLVGSFGVSRDASRWLVVPRSKFKTFYQV